MLNKKTLIASCFIGGLGFSTMATSALYEKEGLLSDNDKLKVTADFRFRVETDWNSQKADGSERDDRTRLRIRARMGMDYSFLEHYSTGFRIRTGSLDTQQSPHITIHDFNGNPKGQQGVVFDKWYLKAKFDNVWAWGGRNTYPFWKQNEQFWSDDVNPAGGAFGYQFKLGEDHNFQLIAGGFALPSGGWDFASSMGAGQLVYTNQLSNNFGLTIAAGFFGIYANQDSTPAERYLTGNGQRDYTLFQLHGQLKTSVFSKPLKLGLDYSHNAENYSPDDTDEYTAKHHDDVDGVVVSAVLGGLKKQWDWQLGYYYSYIEALAVNSSYAQDNWVRWGSAYQTRSVDMKGHEIRAGIAFLKNFNLVARVYLADSITTIEDGNRVRFDFNYKF